MNRNSTGQRICPKRLYAESSGAQMEPNAKSQANSCITISRFNILFILFVAWSFCAAAYGQAWTPPKGEGDVSLIYQNLFTRDHFLSNGARQDFGHVRLLGLTQAVDYGFTDRLAVNLSLLLVAGKYYGSKPHQLPIDNGNYHGTAQDIRINVRYNLRANPLVLTPFVAITVPTHDYEFFAHSGVGSGLREYLVGVDFGRQLAPLIKNAYFQTRYSFGINPVVDGVRPIRSRVDAEFGYLVTNRLSLRALAISQIAHSGLNFPVDFPSRTDERWSHHDQTLAISFLNLGGGAAFSLSKSWNVYASMVSNVWGRNGHAINYGLAVGVSWSFKTSRAIPQTFADASDKEYVTRFARLSSIPLAAPPCGGH